MFKILTLNNISVAGLERLPRDNYEVASEIQHPDGILVRSFKMHDMELPETLLAVGRAGAGVNNIPVDVLSKKGVPVFNAPGANANAVKELVLTGMLIAARNVCQAWEFARKLEGDDGTINLGLEDVTIPGTGGRAQITGRPYRRENARWVEGEVRVNVNVYSARLSGPDNLLYCNSFHAKISDARAKPVAIFCKLITEI